MPARYSDFLQKLSSAATPLNGRNVSPMDEILERELCGRFLDESTIKPPFDDLILRLFPSPSEVTPEELNQQHSDLVEQNEVSRKLKLARAATTTRYNLRPRKPPTSPAPPTEIESDAKGISQPLYDTKKKKWNLEAFQPGPEALAFERMTSDSTHSRPTTLHTSPGMLAAPFLDGPMAPGSDQDRGSSGTLQVNPSETVLTDTGSFEDVSRKGAAYDGDSVRDKNYCEPGERKREQEKNGDVAQEIKWATFLNAIAEALLASPGGQPYSGRMWFGCFSSKRLPSEPGQAQWHRKPDLVLLADRRGSTDTVTWTHPKALGELTVSNLQQNTTLTNTLMSKAYILLSSQPWRRYALAFSIAQDELRVYLFDRSGVIISPPINIHNQVEKMCRVIRAFASADDATLGFDPTLQINTLHPHSRSFAPYIGTVEIDGITYDIISILWTSNGFIGRCTNAFHVRPQGAPPRMINRLLDEHDYVVKDSWLDEHLASHEEHIYHHISGIQGVPTLIKAWTVQNAGDDDSTLRHRPSLWDRRLSPEYVTRVHRRLLMTSVGSPLSSFTSQREFLSGLITALEIHERLVVEKNILHRDVSPNNIIFVPSESGHAGERSVLLIDFDYAAHLDGRTVPYPKGTGTLPFVSMEILRHASFMYPAKDNNEIPHEIADDLESFFYVFTWFCILYDGPNSALSTPSENNSSLLHGWAEAAMERGGLTNALNAKNMFVHALQSNQIIRNQFTPYFQNLKQLAMDWKALVKVEDDRRVSLREPESNQVPRPAPLTHRKIIDLLRHHLDSNL